MSYMSAGFRFMCEHMQKYGQHGKIAPSRGFFAVEML